MSFVQEDASQVGGKENTTIDIMFETGGEEGDDFIITKQKFFTRLEQ